jgi:phage terminase large subunit
MTPTLPTPSNIHLLFPEKLKPLFLPARIKVAYGGRGGAKSWGFARALLLKMTQAPLRVLCAREVQKSIKDSVHKLLADQIELMGLEDRFEVLETEIRCLKTGAECLFTGLSAHTVTSIKSYEGIDIAWVEEAQNVSKKSWDILTPTIRKDASEIWITLNPELDTDETYARFILNPPPNSLVIPMSWRDNPWFNDVLDAERLHCQATQPDDYPNIWEGECRQTIAGAIYATEVLAMQREGRYGPCPYDPRLRVHTIWDMGWNDAMAILLVQRRLSECRIIGYLEGSFKRTDEWGLELNRLKLNWGWDYLPFDAYAQDRRGGRDGDDAAILRRVGRKVKTREQSIPKLDVETGIRAARGLLARSYVNKGGMGTERLMECLKRYRRSIPKSTGEPADPVHDEYSHGCDAIRHLALVVDKLTNDDEGGFAPVIRAHEPFDLTMGAMG